LSPEVAATFVRRVALLGGESSGKTTLAAALAARLGTCWVAEYGRELWEAQAGALTEADLLAIGQEQVRREEAALARARGWLVCDTTPLTTFGYAHWMFGRADPRLAELALRRYDRIVLCRPDFGFVQDGTRREAPFRDEQHAWYRAQLQAGDTPWCEVGGALDQRVDSMVAWLAEPPR
jgi:NadR type nicotinamide-nucleotide adenylyltransferase